MAVFSRPIIRINHSLLGFKDTLHAKIVQDCPLEKIIYGSKNSAPPKLILLILWAAQPKKILNQFNMNN